MVIVVSEQVFLVFNVWLARDTRWKLLSECFAEAIWSYCGGSTQNQVVFRLFEKSRPLETQECWPVCWYQPLHLPCRLSGTSQWQDRHLANGNAIAGRRWGPPSWVLDVSRWLKKLFVMNVQMSSEFYAHYCYWMFIQKPTTRWRKVSVLPVRPGEFGKNLMQVSHFQGASLYSYSRDGQLY